MIMDKESNTSKRIDEIYPSTLYHYTSLEKFKCMLQFGTLRFKLSTQSNDLLDTHFIINLIKQLQFFSDDTSDEKQQLLKILIGYFQRDEYISTRLSFVSCFTDIADSRLLWDAYTINRPPLEKCEIGKDKYCQNTLTSYNGVCVGFKRDSIRQLLSAADGSCDFESAYLMPIYYSEQEQLAALDYFANEAWEIFEKIKLEPDQSQSLIHHIVTGYQLDYGEFKGPPHFKTIALKKCFVQAVFSFIRNIEITAPIFKHSFWHEESEYRAVLCRHKSMDNATAIVKGSESNLFVDLPINCDMIDNIILGPTFS